MAVISKRQKGSALTELEMDNNFEEISQFITTTAQVINELRAAQPVVQLNPAVEISAERGFKFFVPNLQYSGVFARDKMYQPGEIVFHVDAFWISKNSIRAADWREDEWIKLINFNL